MNTAATATHIETSEYERSHGRKPRGRGLWWFRLDSIGYQPTLFAHNGPYTEAYRTASRWAAGRGFDRITVLP